MELIQYDVSTFKDMAKKLTKWHEIIHTDETTDFCTHFSQKSLLLSSGLRKE